ncbi:DMT family transporter [Acidothermaceae bacterium B102]|nr:DMT family transporter [Acidothermaceae bacterium B102]
MEPTAGRRARAGLLQISAAGILWGTTGVVVQLVREHTTLGPISIGFYRLAVAALVLLALQARQLPSLVAAVRAQPVALVLLGVGLGAYQALYFVSVAAIGVSISTMVSLGVAPVCVAVWESVAARQRPDLLTIGSLAGGVLGLVIITVAGGHTTTGARHPVLGLVTAILCGIGYAATTVLSRHVSQTTPAMTLTTASTFFGCLALLPLALVSGLGFSAGAAPVGYLVYMGVVATAVSYLFFYAGLRTTSGSVAAVLTLLEPLTAAVLAVIVLGEPASALEVVGGVILLAAISALYLTPRPPTAPVPV